MFGWRVSRSARNLIGPILDQIKAWMVLPYWFRSKVYFFENLFFYDWRYARNWAVHKLKEFL